jgi:hypothetical protein
VTKRSILTRAVALLALIVVVGALLVLQTFYHPSPQTGPSVEVVTTRCVRPDGQPVGDAYGQLCPPGTTPDTIVIQSLLPTAQP